ncbi:MULTISPECIES: hypothetical protein [Nocardia]|uniref:hypothetical protein n=1 Tax=Nocardia abscessus TaxID=120957 RepID=UPI001893D509|nr:hypothetical protein [Nocardia abscessus]MBF6470772.1 hypothetical protein [Nocardia abscessus]
MAIDVRARHPTRRFLAHDMFASLRRWTGAAIPADEIPLTLDAMHAAGRGPRAHLGVARAGRRPHLQRRDGGVGGGGAAAPASHRVGGPAQADGRRFPGHALDGLDALGLDEQAREQYLDGNARRVFGLTGWPLGANALARRRVAGVLVALPRLGP